MVQAIPQLTTFDDFLAWYPAEGRYELINGRVWEVKPTGAHEQVGGYLNRRLSVEMDRLALPYFIPKSCTVKPFSEQSGYLPDVVVVDRTQAGGRTALATRVHADSGNIHAPGG